MGNSFWEACLELDNAPLVPSLFFLPLFYLPPSFFSPLNLNYIVLISVHDQLLSVFLTHQFAHLEALSVVQFFSVMKMWI